MGGSDKDMSASAVRGSLPSDSTVMTRSTDNLHGHALVSASYCGCATNQHASSLFCSIPPLQSALAVRHPHAASARTQARQHSGAMSRWSRRCNATATHSNDGDGSSRILPPQPRRHRAIDMPISAAPAWTNPPVPATRPNCHTHSPGHSPPVYCATLTPRCITRPAATRVDRCSLPSHGRAATHRFMTQTACLHGAAAHPAPSCIRHDHCRYRLASPHGPFTAGGRMQPTRNGDSIGVKVCASAAHARSASHHACMRAARQAQSRRRLVCPRPSTRHIHATEREQGAACQMSITNKTHEQRQREAHHAAATAALASTQDLRSACHWHGCCVHSSHQRGSINAAVRTLRLHVLRQA